MSDNVAEKIRPLLATSVSNNYATPKLSRKTKYDLLRSGFILLISGFVGLLVLFNMPVKPGGLVVLLCTGFGGLLGGFYCVLAAFGLVSYDENASTSLQQSTDTYYETPSRNWSSTNYIYTPSSLGQLMTLPPREFEMVVRNLFIQAGYQADTTPITGDQGVDLFLYKGGLKAVVQCKRYKGTVGQPVVRDLYGSMLHYQASEAYLVTTGNISNPARDWAQGKPIHLIDGFELINFIREMRIGHPY
jgi:hypothetical protein